MQESLRPTPKEARKLSPQERAAEFVDKRRMNRTSLLARRGEREKLLSEKGKLVEKFNTAKTGEELAKLLVKNTEMKLEKERLDNEIRRLLLENSALASSIDKLKPELPIPAEKLFPPSYTPEEEAWFKEGENLATEAKERTFRNVEALRLGKKIEKLGAKEPEPPVTPEEIDDWVEKAA